MIVNPLWCFVIDQHLRISNLTSTNREGPIVAGNVIRASWSIKLENDADIVWQFLVGEVGDQRDVVPQAEEGCVGRLRISWNRAEDFCAKRQYVVIQRGFRSVGDTPVTKSRVVLNGFKIERRQ